MVTKSEYLQLIQEAYNSDNVEDTYDVNCIAWTPSEPIKKKPPTLIEHTNATSIKGSAIAKIVKTSKQITVGKFLVFVKSRTIDLDGYNLLDITVYETRFKTNTGLPCNLQLKVNIVKDNRFQGRPWQKYFAKGFSGDFGKNIPENVAVDIVRWLQAITKLPAFL